MSDDSREIEIDTGGPSAMRAFLALPAKAAAPSPGVLVIHEVLGLNEDIRRITRRFASLGYAALAPDLYSLAQPRALCVLRTFQSLARRQGPALDALEAARASLASRPEVDAERIGVAGFCMGGAFALMLAVRSQVGVAASFYGDVPEQAAGLEGACPVLGGYGARDRIFGRAGERLERLLSQLGVEHDVVVYPNAGHSYMNHHGPLLAWLGAVSPMRTGFADEASEDSWRRMTAFFARHLA